MNYFDFYGLPIRFELDETALRTKFYEYSRQYHPDRFSLADEAAQETALQQSVRNNQAFRVLNNADLRMRYVLEIGGLVGDETKQATLPQAFLMDMMDINETIMDLQMNFDADRYAAVRAEVDTMLQTMSADIQPVLSAYQADTSPTSDLILVRDFFLKKKYLLRIVENLATFARR